MTRIFTCLLTLLFSLSGPGMGKNGDFGRFSFAAKEGATLEANAIRFSQSNVRSSLPELTQVLRAEVMSCENA
jgi:hypothetical protein